MDDSKISYRVMKVGNYKDAVVYRIPCDCQDPECDMVLEFEIDKDFGMVALTLYKNMHWSAYWMPKNKSWIGKILFRIKEAIKMLCTGHLQIQGDMVILDNDHMEAFELAIKEAKEFFKQKEIENEKTI